MIEVSISTSLLRFICGNNLLRCRCCFSLHFLLNSRDFIPNSCLLPLLIRLKYAICKILAFDDSMTGNSFNNLQKCLFSLCPIQSAPTSWQRYPQILQVPQPLKLDQPIYKLRCTHREGLVPKRKIHLTSVFS